MAGTSIGPVKLMIRADSTSVDDDLKLAENKIKVKAGLMRVNPALGFMGAGMSKGFMKQMMREMPGLLGAEAFGTFAGALGGFASVLGPIGLGLTAITGVAHHFINAMKEADPESAKQFDAAWDRMMGNKKGERSLFLLEMADFFDAIGKVKPKSSSEGGILPDWLRIGGAGHLIENIKQGKNMSAEEYTQWLAERVREQNPEADDDRKVRMGTLDSFSESLTSAAFGATGPVQQMTEAMKETAENTRKMVVKTSDPDTDRGLRGM